MKTAKRFLVLLLCVTVVFVSAYSFPASATSNTVLINDGVNIRNNPGTSGTTVLCTTSKFTEAVYLGSAYVDSKEWYHIQCDIIPGDVKEGYVISDYARMVPETSPETFNSSSRVMVTATVNVREQPSINNTKILCLQWPESVECKGTVIRNGETWYNIITSGGYEGYIRGDYIEEYTYLYDDAFEKTLLQFPVNYRDGLRHLHSLHPNWTFYADNIPITVDGAASIEEGRKLLTTSSQYLFPSSWYSTASGTTVEPGYKMASSIAIRHFMSPEYFITPVSVFMFMQQSYDPSKHTAQEVKKIVKNSFLDNDTYIGYIMEAAKESNVSPYVIAATILQEQSRSGSALCSGNYTGFEGYYNFFNIGASGSSSKEIIEKGLTYAVSKGWDSPQKSITGGAKQYGSYVSNNQDTYYYKNFNVINQKWSHQYATNLHDSLSSANNVYEAYSEPDSIAIFRIPVFQGSDFGEATHTHVYGAGVVTKAATTAETGIVTYTCTVCGAKKNEIIPIIKPTVKKGDVNGDGEINSLDGAKLRLYFLGIRQLNSDELVRADINSDGYVDSIDGARLRLHFLQLKPLE